MTARFRVDFAGPLVTVQDGGRPGGLRYGVPASGAMDRAALALANHALGLPPGTPGVEVSRGGLRLTCLEGAETLAICGGGFIVERGAARFGSWQVLGIRAGETLTIRPGPWGNWCCIAFAGGLNAPRWLGSAATHAASGLGGGVLKTGDSVTSGGSPAGQDRPLPCPVWARPQPRPRLVIGPQDRFFPPDALERLQGATFTITPQGDRMGVRLSGPHLTPAAALAIPSEPILRGSLQVAGDGVVTVLLADHQTTGGYPKIATMLDADTDGFAQLRPGSPLQFRLISPAQAVQAARLAAHTRNRVPGWPAPA